MKKIITALLVLCMILSMTACGKKEEPQTGAVVGQEIENPMTQYDSLENLNKVLGCDIIKPDNLGKIENEAFFTYKNDGQEWIEEYQFTADGMNCSFRATPYTYEDISGLHINEGPAFENFHPGNDYPITYAYDKEFKVARWFTEDQKQYTLCIQDNGSISEEDFRNKIEEITTHTGLMAGFEFYDMLAGEYQDRVSGRANMTIQSVGWEGIMFTVSWADSASTVHTWEGWAKRIDNGHLNYEDCLHQVTEYDESGAEKSKTIIEENQIGYFDLADGVLFWQGAADENCRNCEFEMIPAAQ